VASKKAPVKNSDKAAAKKAPSKSAAKSAPNKNGAAVKSSAKTDSKIDPKKSAAAKVDPKKVPAAKAAAAKVDPKKAPAAKAAAKVDPKKVPAAKAADPKAADPKANPKADPKKVPAAKKPEPAVAATKPADAKKSTGSGKGKDASDPPSVPKKGPIDLAQHKSVAEAAAAVANARGGTGEFIIINGRRVRAISTKGISVAKKTKATTTEAEVGPSEQQIREIKTKLSKKELDEYKALLQTKRRQLVGMLSGMEDEALRQSGGNLSNMPVHMADMGSDVYEQDFTLGMAETERAIINEIDAALQRIEDKTFGVCQMTGKPIAKARLDAKPWAKYTIEAERIAESNGPR
jgi:DnaK suppressor protein